MMAADCNQSLKGRLVRHKDKADQLERKLFKLDVNHDHDRNIVIKVNIFVKTQRKVVSGRSSVSHKMASIFR